MGRKRRHRTELAEAQLELGLPGLSRPREGDTPPQRLNSPDPSNDLHLRQDSHQADTRSPGSTTAPGDSRAQAGAGDRASVPPRAVGDRAICDSACALALPLTSEQQAARPQSPPRRLTLDALLRVAKVVETLRDKAVANGAATDDPLGAAERSSAGTGDGESRGSTTAPAGRSGRGGPHTGPAGGPTLPLAHGEHEQ